MNREIIGSGRALRKLTEWVDTQSDQEKRGMRTLLSVAEAAGVKQMMRPYL